MTLHVVPDHHDPDERFYGSEGPPVRRFHVTFFSSDTVTTLVRVSATSDVHAKDLAAEEAAELYECDCEVFYRQTAEVDDEYGGITSV
tara:strand:+ start:1353 stop:1616 length:264 start_codon:yes stop_codon:yes gene_type:complete